MKNLKLTILFCVASIFLSTAQNEFIFRIETTTNDQAFTIPADGSGINYNVDWGDTNSDANVTGSIPHTYVSPGEYTITITGNLPWFRVNNNPDIRDMIISIEQWGTNPWQSMEDAFYGCSNLVINATDAPDLSMATSLNDVFRNCTSLQNPDLSSWNVSTITSMSSAFSGASSFNGNITTWDVGSVISFTLLFNNANNFNQNISGWNIGERVTGNVIDMRFVFANTQEFDQPIGSWNMSKVNDATSMFNNAVKFNQPIANWDVSNIQFMQGMFNGASAFNQSLGDWDISNVSNLNNMLNNTALGTDNYDTTLIGWATLGTGETQIPTSLSLGANGLNYCNSTVERAFLTGTPYNWNITGDTQDCVEAFISTWQTIAANETITVPTVSGQTYDYSIDWGDGSPIEIITTNASPSHQYATAGIYTTTIIGTFPRIQFSNTGDKDKILSIENWGATKWSSMRSAFYGCTNLVLNATDTPDLSMADSMDDMFRGATNFVDNGGAIGNWDVSTITNMSELFQNTTVFNSNINAWNVSNVIAMSAMFSGNPVFNQPLSNWDVANVDAMNSMFFNATAFNQDLSSWDVSGVRLFNSMFWGASSFDQSLGNWDISSGTSFGNMLTNTNLSIANYDQTLIGWATLDTGETQIPANITLDAEFLFYCNSVTERAALISAPFNWDIRGDFFNCGNPFVTTWQTTTPNETITIPTNPGLGYNYTINWGDGSAIESMTSGTPPSHQYTNAGTYTVEIVGVFSQINFNNTGDKDKILSIENWGDAQWSSMRRAFYGCTNLVLNATDIPDLSLAESMVDMFRGATAFVDNGGAIGSWNVSTITNMSGLFQDIQSFNSNINNWDVSNVTAMTSMLASNPAFNQPLGNWDVGSAEVMNGMFSGATAFNQDLSSWDVSNVRLFTGMFDGATGFDQSLGSWDISSGEAFSNMLNGTNLSTTNYDTTLTGWATLDAGETQIPTNITLGAAILFYCNSATERAILTSAPLNWTIIGDTFNCGNPFVTIWQTTTPNETITIPTNPGLGYNYTINWGDGSPIESKTSGTPPSHQYTNAGNYTIEIIGFFPLIRFNNSGDKDKILSIENWGDTQWISMSSAFNGCTNIVLNATDSPDLSMANSMSNMFSRATAFVDNGDAIGNWNVSNITGMIGLFSDTAAFNSDISNWDVSNVTVFNDMFENATSFDQSLGNWDVSSATDMRDMLSNTNLSIANYDATLIGWATLETGETQIPTNIFLRANGLTYCTSESERATLTSDPFNWTITGDVLDCIDSFITTWQTTTANETITIPTASGQTYNYVIDWGDGSTIEAFTTDVPPSHQYTSAGVYTITITGVFPRIFFNNTGDKDKILSIENWGATTWTSMVSAFSGCANLVLNATDVPDLSMANSMHSMFSNATNLVDNGGAMGSWNVSSINLMTNMFFRCLSFNASIGGWDVSNVLALNSMFFGASAFNQDLSGWDVSGVAIFNNMLQGASSFDQSLGSWDIASASDFRGMLSSSGLSTLNYDATLIGWATLDAGETQIPTGISLGADGLTYCTSESERETLTSTPFNWTITGDTLDCTTLSTDDVAFNTFSLYPNPVSDILYIESTQQQLTKVEILDIAGKKVYSSTINLNEINMQSLDAGLYLIKLFTQTSSKILKVVKK